MMDVAALCSKAVVLLLLVGSVCVFIPIMSGSFVSGPGFCEFVHYLALVPFCFRREN